MKAAETSVNAAAAGGTEGDDGFAGEVVALQKRIDDLRRLSPPDGIADEHHVIPVHIVHTAGDGGAGGIVVLLLIGPAAIGIIV